MNVNRIYEWRLIEEIITSLIAKTVIPTCTGDFCINSFFNKQTESLYGSFEKFNSREISILQCCKFSLPYCVTLC